MDPAYSSLYKPLANSFETEGLYEEAFETAKEGIRVDEFNKEPLSFCCKSSLKNEKAFGSEGACFVKRWRWIPDIWKPFIHCLPCFLKKKTMRASLNSFGKCANTERMIRSSAGIWHRRSPGPKRTTKPARNMRTHFCTIGMTPISFTNIPCFCLKKDGGKKRCLC